MPEPLHPGDVTVVLCTYTLDRWDDLVAAVGSALDQEPPPAEVLLVVDHAEEVAVRARAAFARVRVVENRHVQGLSGARNTALEEVGTAVVAFLDDDARARPGWLAALVRPFADPAVAGVGGRILPAWDTARPGWFPPVFAWVVGCTHTGVPLVEADVRNPIGANMAFRTDLIRDAGGFSTALGRVGARPVGCEETEASIRIAQGRPGSVFRYVPDAVVDHHVPAARATWRYFRSRCYAEGWSKAFVRTLSAEPLGTERAYATRVLPAAVAGDLRSAVRGDPGGLGRAGAIVAGLGLTAAGYVVGLLGQRRDAGWLTRGKIAS